MHSELQNFTYAYDKVGNVARIRDDANSGQRQCFSYDPLDRLTDAFIGDSNCAAVMPPVGLGAYSEHYAYSADGNLTEKAGAAYTYQDAGHPQAVTHVGGAAERVEPALSVTKGCEWQPGDAPGRRQVACVGL